MGFWSASLAGQMVKKEPGDKGNGGNPWRSTPWQLLLFLLVLARDEAQAPGKASAYAIVLYNPSITGRVAVVRAAEFLSLKL